MVDEKDFKSIKTSQLKNYLGKEIILKTHLDEGFIGSLSSVKYYYRSIILRNYDSENNTISFSYKGREYSLPIFKINDLLVKRK